MLKSGFEVGLVLALSKLLKGELLSPIDFQVINCAYSEEKFEAFAKVVCSILYDDENAFERIKNFKLNLKLISAIKSGQSSMANSISNPKTYAYVAKSELLGYSDYDMILENAMLNLLNGELLCIKDVSIVSASNEIDLIDALGYVLRNKYRYIEPELRENVDLNCYILKSLKLTESVDFYDVNIKAISREECEEILSKLKERSLKMA